MKEAHRIRAWLGISDDPWARIVLGPLLLACCFVAVVWHLTLSRLDQEQAADIRRATSDNLHLAVLVEQSLSQVVNRVNGYAEVALAVRNGRREFAPLLSPTIDKDGAYLKLALFGGDGGLLYSSSRQADDPELIGMAERATQGWRRLPPPGTTVIGRRLSKTSAWSIPLMTGIGGKGANPGLLVSVLDLGYFLQAVQEVKLAPGSRIEIITTDGYQVAEADGGSLSSGRDYRDSDYLKFLLGATQGSGEVDRDDDRAVYVTAYARSGSYPIVAVVGQDKREVLRDFEARRVNYLTWAWIDSVALVVGALALSILTLRKRASHLALIRSEKEVRALVKQLEGEKKQAYDLASHDHLTGLPNRLLFAELARSHIHRARRSRLRHAVMFVDLDRFKIINDMLGHRSGDFLLIEVARRFRQCVRESDVIARLGGDEFVFLINDADSVPAVEEMAKKIIATVREPFVDADGNQLQTTPSIGIALYPTDGDDIEVLLRHADEAMYAAKKAGRGTYRFHDSELNKHVLRQFDLLQGLRQAVREEQFVLHYQPIVALDDLSVVGLEALLRWKHPEFGLIYPNDFVALAESHGLMEPLGHWVIESVCDQLAAWRRSDLPLVPVTINVAGAQLENSRLADQLRIAMECRGLGSGMIEVEIAERCLVDPDALAVHALSDLAVHGIRIEVDDCGTAGADLWHLRAMPLSAIKIDRSLIREILNDGRDTNRVASLITLAHNLGLSVVAEGVEAKAQVVYLKTAGCDRAQGYYFQRPLPASEIEAVLTRRALTK